MATVHASRPQSERTHERDRNFKELVTETLLLIDSQASRIQKSWPGGTAATDFFSAILAHSVKKLGPQSAREMLNQQLGKIKSVN